LLLINFGVKNFIQNVHHREANACCKTTPLRLLHHDVPVVHATTTLNMAKSRTKLKHLWQKVIYFCFQSIEFFIAIFSTIFMFFVLQRIN